MSETPVFSTNSTDTYTSIPLRGTSLVLARGTAFFLIVSSLAIYIYGMIRGVPGITQYYNDFYGFVLEEAGLRAGLVTVYILAMEALSLAVFLAVALLLATRRSDDLVSLTIAAMLATWGVSTSNTAYYALGANVLVDLLAMLLINVGYILFVWFLYTAPNGRFDPPWSRWILGIWSIFLLAGVVVQPAFENAMMSGFSFALQVTVYLLGFVVVAYRAKKVFTAAQVQQFKWVMLGMSGAFLGFVVRFLPYQLFPILSEPNLGALVFEAASSLFLHIGLTAVPVTIAFSIMRFRLYDVDLMLNRSLVYGGVTVLLVFVMVIDIVAFLWILQVLTGGEQPTIAIIIGTAIPVAAFQPMRRHIQRFVDRKIYGIEVDYRNMPVARSDEPADPGPPTNPALDDDTTFGPYKVYGLIGRGGMAEVYKGHHPTLNRPVAIKVLSHQLAAQDDFRERFHREAQIIASVRHTNVVQVFDFGVEGDTYFMVMEYIDGPSLSQVMKDRGALPYEEVTHFVRDIAEALTHAHVQGIIHRDVKPSNVMIRTSTATGETGLQRAVLTDFGIAKMVGRHTLTGTGMMGTLDYIAPEQIKASTDVDGRADTYALGVMTYQLLTGKVPFKADNPGTIIMSHLTKPAPDPREATPEIPKHAALAVMRAMEKQPESRFQSPVAFAEHFMDEAVTLDMQTPIFRGA